MKSKTNKQQIIEWLKTQRHKRGRIGVIGTWLYHEGICFMSDQDNDMVNTAYSKHKKQSCAHNVKSTTAES